MILEPPEIKSDTICTGSLAPHFVNNDYVAAEIIYSTGHVRDEVPAWSQAAAAAKLLRSCLTLCDPKDGSPPGSSVPGILQARILE